MGGVISNTCGNCCFNTTDELKPILAKTMTTKPNTPSMHKDVNFSISNKQEFAISDFSNAGKLLNNGYSSLILYSLEDFTDGYEEMIRQYGCRVYAKDTVEGVLIKADWLTHIAGKDFIQCFYDLEKRKKWDTNIEELKIIETNEEWNFSYTLFRKKFAINQRDMVLASKIYKDHSLVSTSVFHPLFPANSVIQRINIKLAGFHTIPIAKDELNNITKVFAVIEADFGGSVPKTIIKKIISMAFPSLVSNIDKFLKSCE